MAAPDWNNSNGMLNGNGVGIALAAIFVGVALAVAFIASDGAIFGQIFQSAPSNTGPANDSGTNPAAADGEATVTSRDVFNQGSGDDVPDSVSLSDASRNDALPGEQEANSVTHAEQRQLLAIKNFPWSSIAVEQINSSQNIMNKFKQQDEAQQKPAQPELESLFLTDEISVDVDRDRDDNVAEDDVSLADVIDISPIDILVIDDDEQERPDEEQPADTSGTSEDQQDDSEDNEEQSSSSGSGSNNTDTQGPSEDSDDASENDGNGGNSTGIEVTISLG